jgi:hypothetical protein
LRKFGPKTVFTSVINLVSSPNNDGYQSALRRSWQQCGLRCAQTPAKSSLSEVREKVSSDFFQDIYEVDLKKANRSTYRKFHVYAVDGDVLDVPASQDILNNGYRGASISKEEETHYPKMYTVQALDLISGEIRAFSQSSQKGERRLAWPMIKGFEKNSIAIYDRLYDCFETAYQHVTAGNYFFVRVKSNNPNESLVIQEFCQSRKRSSWIELKPSVEKRREGRTEILKLRLIKVKNKKTREDLVFLTNVPEGLISNKDAACFYLRRWGIEGSFRDLTDTLKMCQWHSTKLNGILQEIYALLWLVNQVRRLTNAISRSTKSWLDVEYEKANFKAVMLALTDNLNLLLQRKYRTLHKILLHWTIRTIERRKHLSRSYPRHLKRLGRTHKNASRIGRRPAAV